MCPTNVTGIDKILQCLNTVSEGTEEGCYLESENVKECFQTTYFEIRDKRNQKPQTCCNL